MISNETATVVAELTPVGRAAVAVVVVAGANAAEAVEANFIPATPRPVGRLPIGAIALGRWGDPDGEELIVCRRGLDAFEIHCHGGTAAVNAVIDRLVATGCRRVSWQEWLQSWNDCFTLELAGDSTRDALSSAAHIALAEAATSRVAAVLLDQYNGALSGAIRAASAKIGHGEWTEAAAILDRLLGWRELGEHLTTPWRVVLAGAPNVGKSSLINALAGYERAIVSPQPGTTRDVVTLSTAIAGWPVQLADTAGLRDSAESLEAQGVELAIATLASADLVIAVHDASHVRDASQPRARFRVSSRGADTALSLSPCVRTLQVWNKIDLVAPRARLELDAGIATSATSGEGLADLTAAIAETLVPAVPPTGEAVPFCAAQCAGLEAARRAIERRDAGGAVTALRSLLESRLL